MRSPKLRHGKIKQLSLESFLKEDPNLQWFLGGMMGRRVAERFRSEVPFELWSTNRAAARRNDQSPRYTHAVPNEPLQNEPLDPRA
jgi:hypothetical protein